MDEEELEGELVSEEDADGQAHDDVRALPREVDRSGPSIVPAIRNEVTTAALAVAGGALAGAATVAAVRAVGGSAGKKGRRRRPSRRSRPGSVLASRSFLIDVHLLDG